MLLPFSHTLYVLLSQQAPVVILDWSMYSVFVQNKFRADCLVLCFVSRTIGPNQSIVLYILLVFQSLHPVVL